MLHLHPQTRRVRKNSPNVLRKPCVAVLGGLLRLENGSDFRQPNSGTPGLCLTLLLRHVSLAPPFIAPRPGLNPPVVTTLLELADATSHNLDFAHRPGVRVSYGEETITETSLLEIARRHPQRARLQMFSKHQEALNGADWEWHIVGRRRTLKMRVQAKRLQRNDVLRVKHQVASSGKQQRQLLIDAALADRMKPLYCIYCTERQRSIWAQTVTPDGSRSYQLGCLLVDATKVPLSTRRLLEIEHHCFPWHFLFERSICALARRDDALVEDPYSGLRFLFSASRSALIEPDDSRVSSDTGSLPPTVNDLNDEPLAPFDETGVDETSDEDRARLETDTDDAEEIRQADHRRLVERRISRMLVIDVRGELVTPPAASDR